VLSCLVLLKNITRPPFAQLLETFAAAGGEEKELRAALERAYRSILRTRSRLGEEAVLRRRQSLRLVGSHASRLGSAELDSDIEALATEERQLAAEYRSSTKAMRSLLTRMREEGIEEAQRAERVFRAFDELMIEMLERTRDIRWQLMAHRAERPEARGGRIVKDARSLRRHLARLSG
jgi:hypothetical protein